MIKTHSLSTEDIKKAIEYLKAHNKPEEPLVLPIEKNSPLTRYIEIYGVKWVEGHFRLRIEDAIS